MTNAYTHLTEALRIKNLILDGKSNETPRRAWVSVARECAKAEYAMRETMAATNSTRCPSYFWNTLDRVQWYARAQVETLTRAAA